MSNSYRSASGFGKISTGANPNDIAGYSYNVELLNALRTQKKIFSLTEYQVGQKILDLDTGIYAEVLSKEAIKRRDLF